MSINTSDLFPLANRSGTDESGNFRVENWDLIYQLAETGTISAG